MKYISGQIQGHRAGYISSSSITGKWDAQFFFSYGSSRPHPPPKKGGLSLMAPVILQAWANCYLDVVLSRPGWQGHLVQVVKVRVQQGFAGRNTAGILKP